MHQAIAFQLLIPSIAIFFGMLLLKFSSGSSAPPVMFKYVWPPRFGLVALAVAC